MPVKKKPAKKAAPKKTNGHVPKNSIFPPPSPIWIVGDGTKKILITLVAIFLVYVTVWVGTLIRNNLETFDHIGFADRVERTIAVSGEGAVTVAPDTAITTIGMLATAPSVEEAQAQNTEVMNQLMSRLRDLGIEDADIQTENYNVNPRYTYTQFEGQVLQGYDVNQRVTVKIRDLEVADQVIALAGEVGANSVGGLQFVVDDEEVYMQQAREEALGQVATKAQNLSKVLGVRIVGVAGYEEFEGGGPVPIARVAELGVADTFGGAVPEIAPGSTEVNLTTRVIFEIR